MKVTVLLENTSHRDDMIAKHGLSLFFQTNQNAFLFDAGPDDSFLVNAEKLKINLSDSEFTVLSHGHYDHGGGLPALLRQVKDQKIYLRKGTFRNFTNGSGKYIGLDRELFSKPNLIFTDEQCSLSPKLLLFSEVQGHDFLSPICSTLFCDGQQDDFSHEQSLLVEDDGKLILVGGCAHCGIVNILEKAREIAGRYPDFVLSGLHLSVHGRCSDNAFLKKLAKKLAEYPTQFYTFHCSGTDGFEKLKEELGSQIAYLSTGDCLELP